MSLMLLYFVSNLTLYQGSSWLPMFLKLQDPITRNSTLQFPYIFYSSSFPNLVYYQEINQCRSNLTAYLKLGPTEGKNWNWTLPVTFYLFIFIFFLDFGQPQNGYSGFILFWKQSFKNLTITCWQHISLKRKWNTERSKKQMTSGRARKRKLRPMYLVEGW